MALENFEVNEVKPMLDLLGVFEYISYDELFFRLNNLLTSILEHIPVEDEILIIPYGKMGKSSIYITYPISHTPIYKKQYKYKNDIKIEISNDIKNIKLNNVETVIFIDDFIGTGNSFIGWYKDKEQSSLRFF